MAAAAGAVVAFVAPTVFGGFFTTVAGQLLASVAFTALSQALVRKPSLKNTAGLTGEVTTQGGNQSQTIVLGRTATGGHLNRPPQTHGNAGKTPNAFLTMVFELCDMPVGSLARVAINGEWVTLGSTPDPDYGLPVQGKYAGKAWVKFYDGTQTAADAMLVNRYGSATDRPWSSSSVLSGVAYAICTFRRDQNLFQGQPSLRFEIDGISLYDPRKDTSVGGAGTHRWADPTTWEFTTNPKVMQYNLFRGITLPDGRTYGGRAEAGDLPLSSWFAAMNVCDEAVALSGGGTETRYRAGLEVAIADNDPADVIDELDKACSGDVVDMGGTWYASAGGVGISVYAFTDKAILATEAETFRPFDSDEDLYNAIHASFPDPGQIYEAVEAPPIYDAALLAAQGGEESIAELNVPAAPYPTQVQRLMRSWLNDAQRLRRHALPMPPAAAFLIPTSAVTWTSADNGYASKVFEVTGIADEVATARQALSIRERDPTDYDWSSSDEQATLPAAGITPLPAAEIVQSLAMVGIAIVDAAANERRPALRVTWDATDVDAVLAIQFEFRIVGQATPFAYATHTTVSDEEYILAEAVLPLESYEVRALLVPADGRNVDWSAWVSATAPDVKIDGALDIKASSLTSDLFAEIVTAAIPFDVEVISADDAAWQFKHPGIALVYFWGPGGGGGAAFGDDSTRAVASSGQAGALAIKLLLDVNTTDTHVVTIAAPGVGGFADDRGDAFAGTAGGTSSITGPLLNMTVPGGAGGNATIAGTGTVVALGAKTSNIATGGDLNFRGGYSGDATRETSDGTAVSSAGALNMGLASGQPDAADAVNQTGAPGVPASDLVLSLQFGPIPFIGIDDGGGPGDFVGGQAERLNNDAPGVAGATPTWNAGGGAAAKTFDASSNQANAGEGGKSAMVVYYFREGTFS